MRVLTREEHDERITVAESMEAHGGGFVKTLAKCIYQADPDNLDKIKAAFPEYWEKYKNWEEK